MVMYIDLQESYNIYGCIIQSVTFFFISLMINNLLKEKPWFQCLFSSLNNYITMNLPVRLDISYDLSINIKGGNK